MATHTSRPGIGPLEYSRGPAGLRLWSLEQPPHSALYDDLVVADILLDGTDDLDRADLALVAEVLGGIDVHLEAALRFVHQALLDDPSFFGLAEADLGPYREGRAVDLPLGAPHLTFNAAGEEWLLRFAEGRLPVCEPYGLIVSFDGLRPVRVEDPDSFGDFEEWDEEEEFAEDEDTEDVGDTGDTDEDDEEEPDDEE